MTARGDTALYSTQMLGLAIELADHPYDSDAPMHGHAVSRTCGSTLDLSCSYEGTIAGIGMKVSACAVGQASAALFAEWAPGRTAAETAAMRLQMKSWLTAGGEMPDMPRLSLLEPALLHTGRHGAIMLPWNAAMDALSKAMTAS